MLDKHWSQTMINNLWHQAPPTLTLNMFLSADGLLLGPEKIKTTKYKLPQLPVPLPTYFSIYVPAYLLVSYREKGFSS